MESPVMVQNVTSIPVTVQHANSSKCKPESMESGFPFDEGDFSRGNSSFRSHLDDLAKRHPEFAKHLNFNRDFDQFPFRSNTWGPRRRGSNNKTEEKSSSQPKDDFPEFKHFADRPFGSRFERFGFPFNKSFDTEPHFHQEFEHHPQQNQSQPSQQQPHSSNQQYSQSTASQKSSEQPEAKPQENSEKPPQVPNQERGRKQHPYVSQSNTADLGHRQEAVNETRGQRSMSAPPENRASQPRYVSSINIPINVERGGGGDMGSQQSQQQSQPQQQQQQSNQSSNQQSKTSSHERVIPIHVEGRDEPVIPKHNVHHTFSTPPPRPEPERIFSGQRPSQFAGWPRSEPHYYRGEPHYQQPQQNQQQAKPEETFRQQHHQQQQQAPPPQQQQQQQSPPKQEQQQPPKQQPSQKLTPIEQIEAVQKDVADLMTQVENFDGKPKDKRYLYLDEMLTRNLIKLDNIQTDGQDNVRQLRKEAIRNVQRCISILESKAVEKKQEEPMEVEQKEETKPAEERSMEVEKVEGQPKPSEEEAKPNELTKDQQAEKLEKQIPLQEQQQLQQEPPQEEQQEPPQEEQQQSTVEQQTSSQEQKQSSDENQKEPTTVLEVSGKPRAGTKVVSNEKKAEEAPMEIAPEANAEEKESQQTEVPASEENKPEGGDVKEKKEEKEENKEKKEDKKEKKKVKKKEKSEKK